MTIYFVPIQPLEERYTEQWYRWFPEEFKKRGLKTVIVDGYKLSDTVERGAFLDVNGAHYWGLSQLMNISQIFHDDRVEDGDKFFVADIEFPGHAEAIKNMAKLQGIDIELYGFLHACSVTTEDFVSPIQDSMKYFELGWLSSYDKVFVGSHFFANEFINKRINVTAPKEERLGLARKIVVTGNPWNSKEVRDMAVIPPTKSKQIIFPNRFDFDKRPNLFLDLCLILGDAYDDIKFIITTSRPTMRSCHPWLIGLYKSVKKILRGKIDFRFGLTKREYYQFLANSSLMFSSSIYESFGYCPVEAMTFNTIPIVPNKFAYQETVPAKYRYDSMDEAIELCMEYIDSTDDFMEYPSKILHWDRSIERICNEMCT